MELLPRSERLRVLALDVTNADSIAATLAASGPIDAPVNNAGIGLFGAFEATPMATTREVFETNTFGVMAMTQAVIPQFRARRMDGLIPESYAPFAQRVFASLGQPAATTSSADVAEGVWRAVHDDSGELRFAAGADAVALRAATAR